MADNNEKLILEVEAKGATEATTAIKGLDVVAAQAEALLTALNATSATLSASMTALSGATYFATASLQQNTAAATANQAVTAANTAATISNTAAITSLVSMLTAEQASRAANTAAITANTAASNTNTAVTVANTTATEASIIATDVNVLATQAAAAATLANTTAQTANTAATVANTTASTANAAANTAQTTATTAATTATTASLTARIASTSATVAGTVATAAWTVATWALGTALSAVTGIISILSSVVTGFTGMIAGLTGAFVALAAPLTAILTPLYVFKKLVEGTRVYQDFQAQLEVVTGSAQNAAKAYAALVDYAIKTPYGLKQATDGFVKLVNFGLDPSERAMKALGNIAAGATREFDQMVQAVAMATVNNFVRLKQFGILGRKVGDDVIFTFRGVTTKVRANAKEIQGYLINLGETEFAGAMERRMQSLSGTLSNLGDAWSLFWQAVAKQGPDTVLTRSFKTIERGLVELTAQLESGQFRTQLEAYAIAWRVTIERIQQALEWGKVVVIDALTWISEQFDLNAIDWADLWHYFPIYAGQALDTVIALFKYWTTTAQAESERIRSNMQTFWDQITGYVDVFVNIFVAGWNAIRAGIQPIVEAVTKGFSFVMEYVSRVAEDVKRVWDIVYDSVSGVATAIAEWFKIQFDRLVGYAQVAGQAVKDAFAGVMPNVAVGLKNVTDQAIQATVNFQKNLDAGVGKIKADLQDVTDSANNRYAIAAQRAADTAAQASANLKLEKATISATSEALKKEYDAKMAESERLRKEYDDKLAGQKANSQDRLAEFEKSGNGEGYNGAVGKSGRSSADRAARKAESDARRLLETRMRFVEEGMVMENQVIAAAYEERKRIIMDSEKLTIQEKEALVLVALSESLMTEEEAIRESYDRRREIILESTELTETQRQDLLQKLHKARLKAEQEQEFTQQMERQQQWSDFFGNINKAASAFSKKGFAIAKAAAIAKTTVDTASAAMAAYKDGGGYYGAALAAAAIAAGAAQIATISSTQYQGEYEHGGMIPAGKFGLVGEAGPEFVTGPAVVTSAATTRNNGSLAGTQMAPTVIIQNMGPPMEATSTLTEGRLMVILKPLLAENKAQTKKEISAEVQRGGGHVAGAMERTYGLSRAKTPTA